MPDSDYDHMMYCLLTMQVFKHSQAEQNGSQSLTKLLWPSNELIQQALIVSVSSLTQFE